MLTAACRHLARRRWEYALTASGILFVLSSASIRQPADLPHIDKVEHVTAYALLALAYFNAASAGGKRAGRWVYAVTWLAVVAYGISDEIHQAFVPGRSPDVEDALADAIGGLAGLALARWMRPGFLRRLDPSQPGTQPPPPGIRKPGRTK